MTNKDKSYSPCIADAVEDALLRQRQRYSFDDRHGQFRFAAALRGKLRKINYLISVEKEAYLVRAFCPVSAICGDSAMMAAMAEYICRANYSLKMGSFSLDHRDGEISFKVYVHCGQRVPDDDVLNESICCPAAMFERFGDGILEILFHASDAVPAAVV